MSAGGARGRENGRVSEAPGDDGAARVPAAAGASPASPPGPHPRRPLVGPLDLVDVLVYVVILNLAIEYVPSVLSETFTLSLLTAVLLKLVLELVLFVKGAVLARLRSATSAAGRVVSVAMLVLVLPGSKLLVLEAVALVFGGAVQLGGFLPVTALVVVLILARRGVRWLFRDAGRDTDRGAGPRRSADA